MSKTKAQLEEENDALRAVLAAIGEGMPPLPADPEKMKLYGLECASRLSSVTIFAGSLADCSEDYAAAYAQETVKDLRERWARPLHYQPETGAPPEPPGFDCDCGRRLPWPARVQDETCPDCGKAWEYDGPYAAKPQAAAAIVAKATGAGLCQYCDVEPAIAGNYCEACAPAVQMATGAIETCTPVIAVDDDAPDMSPHHAKAGPWCGATEGDGDFAVICNSQPGHDGPVHVAWAADGGVVACWSVTVTAPAGAA